MAEEDNSVKQAVNSTIQTTGKVLKFVGENVVLPMLTAGTSKFAQLAGKLPQISKALNILGAIKPEKEKKDNTWKWVLIGIGFFFGLPLLTIASIGGAFVSEQNLGLIGTPEEGISIVTPAPLQCSNTRHEAEKIICWLKEGYLQTADCSQSIISVTLSSFNFVSPCLLSNVNPLTNSAIVNREFKNSVTLKDPDPTYSGKLQCVGFVKAVEKSLGHSIDNHHAKDYWLMNCHQEYERIDTTDAHDLQVGDLAVRTTDKYGNPSKYGHISVVIATDGNVKIIVAQAEGTSGEIFLTEDAVTSYSGFLRYKY